MRAALRDAATSSIDGLNPFSYGQPGVVVPAFFVADVELNYGSALESGMDVAVFNCRMLVSKLDEQGGQDRIDEFMSTEADSVKAALEADRTLGGLCFDVFVESVTGPTVYNLQLVDYLGCQFKARVTGRGV